MVRPISLQIIIVAILSLAGCARHVDTRVSSFGVSGVEPINYVMVTPPDVAVDAILLHTQTIVVDALSAKGMKRVQSGAISVLRVAISARPATLILSSGKAEGKPDVLGQAAKMQSSDSCINSEYRVVIDLAQISNGASLYHGSAAEFHCQQSIEAALPNLVAAAIRDFGSPRGQYVIKRKQN